MTLKKKKVIMDFAINILASGIVTIVLQIFIYPFFGRILDINQYGILLTSMGIVNVIASSLGNSLNNVRLLKNSNYKTLGDFNILLLYSSLFSLIISGLIAYILFDMTIFDCILFALLTSICLIRQYLVVTYRLILDFKKLLVNNIYICVGYFVGLLLSYFSGNWIISFLVGELFGVLHCIRKSDLIKEPLLKTIHFQDTYKSYFHLIISILFGQAMLYMDRFIILPFLGSEMVSVYTVASFAGKTLGILALPISSVLLSYYTKNDFVFTKRKLYLIFSSIMLASAVSLIAIQIICPFMLTILYPKIYKLAIPYLLYANIGSVLNIASNVLQPAIMKVSKTKYQVYIQVFFTVIFLLCTLLLLKDYGLYAICISIIISNIFKIALMMVIGIKSLSYKEAMNG